MQHLLELLEHNKYVYWYRKVDGSDFIRDIFWSHLDSIKLHGTLHIVLLIDSTYKTNKYWLPQLEIAGDVALCGTCVRQVASDILRRGGGLN